MRVCRASRSDLRIVSEGWGSASYDAVTTIGSCPSSGTARRAEGAQWRSAFSITGHDVRICPPCAPLLQMRAHLQQGSSSLTTCWHDRYMYRSSCLGRQGSCQPTWCLRFALAVVGFG